MYPKLSDLINDLLGTRIELPVQTYGFFVALAFLFAAMILYLELRRKEKEGILSSFEKTVIKGRPASWVELVLTAVIGFLIGYKLAGALLDYDVFVVKPQKYIFSPQGSWWGGLLLAGAMTFYTWYDKKRKAINPPVTTRETVHPRQLTASILLVAAVFGILGAKLFDVVEHLDQLFRDPLGTLFSFSGLAFYGGLITAAFAVSIYVEKNHIPWKVNADAVAPALMLAYGIGRIGCQLSGDGCWGVVNAEPKPEWLAFLPDWMWAFSYPHNVINEGILIPGCDGRNCHVLEQPVFPTPFYETMMALTFFGVLWLIRKKIRVPGMLFSIYLILNGTERFLIEKIRVNIKYDFLGAEVSQASLIATGLVILGIAGIFYTRRLHRKSNT